jgi:predicted small integral membrane protein
MKKAILINSLFITALIVPSVAFAQSADVAKIESFIKNIIQILVTLSGLVAAGFFVMGGFGYITSTGNPESLDRSKKTLVYSGVGLAIVFGAFVLTNIVSDLAKTAFGG